MEELARFVAELRQNEASGVLVSVPGMGASYYCKKLVEKDPSIRYINIEGQELAKFNILDFDFDRDSEAGRKVDDYFKKAMPDQKFLVIVNRPDLIESGKLDEFFFTRRIYKQLWFRSNDLEMTRLMVSEFVSNPDEGLVKRIFDLSGGLRRIIKYFAVNKNLVDLDLQELSKREDLQRLLIPSVLVINKVSGELLNKLGLKINELMKEMMKNVAEVIDIKVNQEMKLVENGQVGEGLTKIEKQILELAVAVPENVITKESIASQKWGEGSYDEYSDQAISKTIQRLNAKLQKHLFEPIPQVGYKLRRNG